MIPQFLLRKLYKKGSLASDGTRFWFTLQNQIKTATLTSAPQIVVNGIHHRPEDIEAGIDLTKLPLSFARGDEWNLTFQGTLLKGGNRIHFEANTEEFGEIEFLVEDIAAES